MSKFREQVQDFQVQAQLIGFVIKDGYKIKYVRVNISDWEYWIKPEKEIRTTLNTAIAPGTHLEITGQSEWKSGKLKLNASSIIVLDSQKRLPEAVTKTETTPAKTNKACVMICQKSTCWKRGGQEVCQAIENTIHEQGLTEQVQVKLTGCLKQCKNGPNVIIMPDKARYSNVRPQEIGFLFDKHFTATANSVTVGYEQLAR
ncbi:(2Fe-2S) ferredoxin domain-containing protein [Chroococcus sp. FPU101]|uniref:(2Fe-2S) ferredoxin domain-containing protein n=1 Tax=Chroococcus sp. FPU101 TaxID=1974212 RepID=UPI001A8D3C70|nr:(2Fe-2S) ferredoxin domain-containing protein [Chroococcus sp. FPU101]GFE71191.1 iron-sulfur cluster-binding protein like protein [Chroococcus sp. FPU101]